jgi:hypothetical protein
MRGDWRDDDIAWWDAVVMSVVGAVTGLIKHERHALTIALVIYRPRAAVFGGKCDGKFITSKGKFSWCEGDRSTKTHGLVDTPSIYCAISRSN